MLSVSLVCSCLGTADEPHEWLLSLEVFTLWLLNMDLAIIVNFACNIEVSIAVIRVYPDGTS